jgi:hypothetical protein
MRMNDYLKLKYVKILINKKQCIEKNVKENIVNST